MCNQRADAGPAGEVPEPLPSFVASELGTTMTWARDSVMTPDPSATARKSGIEFVFIKLVFFIFIAVFGFWVAVRRSLPGPRAILSLTTGRFPGQRAGESGFISFLARKFRPGSSVREGHRVRAGSGSGGSL